MKVHVAVLLAVLALVALIQPTASAAPSSPSTACSAQVLTSTTTHQQGPEHGVLVTHATRHHVSSAVVHRRGGGRAHTGALTRLPEGLRPLGCLTLVARWGRSTDRLLDRAVTTHPLRL